MNVYIDSYGLYHDKPVDQGVSGNPYIYTAYAAKLGLPIDLDKVLFAGELTKRNINGITFYIRHPNKPNTSPISREEILGRFYLQVPTTLNNWSFSPYPIPSFDAITLIKQLLEAKGEHRNYFWKNNLSQIYRFAFSVPITDRYSILKWSGKYEKFNVIHNFYRAVSFFDSLLPTENGIRWLKYGKSKEAMLKEFPSNHPFHTR